MKIDNTTIKTPTEFSMERFNVTKGGRTSNGDMHLDLVTKKRKFSFTYSLIRTTDLQIITDLIDGNKLFFLLEYPDQTKPSGIDTAMVYVGSINRKLMIKTGDWLWQNFQFTLIEK